MVAVLYVLAMTSLVAFASAAPTTTGTTTCTSTTKTVNFADLPTGAVSPSLNYHGLLYHGWEVVAAKDTIFAPQNGSSHFLRLKDTKGTVQVANPSQYYVDIGSPSSPSFYFGCQNQTAAISCEFSKRYNIVGDTRQQNDQFNTYMGLFNSEDYPHHLEAAGDIDTTSVHLINWSVGEVTGAENTGQPYLYIADYRYTIGNCAQQVTN